MISRPDRPVNTLVTSDWRELGQLAATFRLKDILRKRWEARKHLINKRHRAYEYKNDAKYRRKPKWKSRIVTFITYNPMPEFDFSLSVVSTDDWGDTYSADTELRFRVAKGLEVTRVDLK